MIRIFKEFTFEAAHLLPSAVKGHPNARIHGHSFHVRVTIAGKPDADTGLILHFDTFERALAQAKEQLDHRFLNEIKGLEQPTLETLSAWIWRQLKPVLPGLAEITVSRPSCGEGCMYSEAEHGQ